MSFWLSRLWVRLTTWLEAGTRAAAAGRRERDDDDHDVPWAPGSVAVMPTEPSIDLHHFHPRDVPSIVFEYVDAAHAKGLEEVLIIHGRGKGVQRSVVAKVLTRHPLVESFGAGAGAAGQGATAARLRPRKAHPQRS